MKRGTIHPVLLRMLAALWLSASWVPVVVADQINLVPATQTFLPAGNNQLFIHLANDSTRQGLQLDLSYNPRVLQVVSVAPLGRLQNPMQLYYAIPPTPQGPWRSWPTAVTLHMLAYDGSASRTSIGTGTDAVIVVGVAVRDTVPVDTAYVSVDDVLAASESLAPVPIASQAIAIPLDAVTGTLVSMFTATSIDGGQVRVQWELSSPSLGVNVYRSFANESERAKLNDAPISGPGPYTLLDTPPARAGTLVYELFSAGPSGESSLDRLEVAWGDMPLRFALHQNTPNPFFSATTIRFDVPQAMHVRITVHDVAGRLIRTLQDSKMAPGRYSRQWDGRGVNAEQLPAGVYFYIGQVGNQRISRKAVHLQ